MAETVPIRAAQAFHLGARAVVAVVAQAARLVALVDLAVVAVVVLMGVARVDVGPGAAHPHQAMHLDPVAMPSLLLNLKGFEHATH